MKTNHTATHLIAAALLLCGASTLSACGGDSKAQQQAEAQKLEAKQDSLKAEEAKLETLKAEVEEKEVEVNKDEAIIQFITDFYNNEKFNDTDFLRSHCSSRMLQKLRNAYDYDCDDGDCLAGWIFRSDAQDGDGPTMILNVEPKGDGWYTYKFKDMGYPGSHTIKVTEDNGNFTIQDMK